MQTVSNKIEIFNNISNVIDKPLFQNKIKNK